MVVVLGFAAMQWGTVEVEALISAPPQVTSRADWS
jgi:hypothetical protein